MMVMMTMTMMMTVGDDGCESVVVKAQVVSLHWIFHTFSITTIFGKIHCKRTNGIDRPFQ